MFLKSVKGKIAAGVIVVSVVAGTSTVFAGVDARTQFTNWYHGLLSAKSGEITSKALSNYNAELGDYNKRDYPNLKNDSIRDIQKEGLTKTVSVSSAINNQKDDYKSAIDKALSDINKGIGSDFDKIVSDTNGQVDALNSQAISDKKADLETALNSTGDSSVTGLNKAVSGVSTLAKADLQIKIKTAQAQVNTLIFLKSKEADKKVADHIQAQIDALTKQLSDYAAQLVQANKTKIDTAGDQAQSDALAALDQLVLDIK